MADPVVFEIAMFTDASVTRLYLAAVPLCSLCACAGALFASRADGHIGSPPPGSTPARPARADVRAHAGAILLAAHSIGGVRFGLTTTRAGSTLAELRKAYGTLVSTGTDKWRAKNGMVFVDNAERDPEPPASRVIEIKTATCGDY